MYEFGKNLSKPEHIFQGVLPYHEQKNKNKSIINSVLVKVKMATPSLTWMCTLCRQRNT